MRYVWSQILLFSIVLAVNSANLGVWTGTEAWGEAAQNPTITSVLNSAKEIADRVTDERERVSLRRCVALVMQHAGQEAAFGGYVADAMSAWDAWLMQRMPTRPAPDPEWEKFKALETEAKQSFLSGDQARARQLLLDAESLRKHYQRMDIDARATSEFLKWELETGDLASALQRLRTTPPTRGLWPVGLANEVAQAYAAAGRRNEAIDILVEVQSRPDVSGDLFALHVLAESLWKLGATERGKSIIRQISAAQIDAAERDAKTS